MLKNIRKARVRTARNKAKKKELKKALKEFNLATNRDVALSLLPKVQSIIDKAAKWGIIHKNKAGRLKAKLAKSLAVMK